MNEMKNKKRIVFFLLPVMLLAVTLSFLFGEAVAIPGDVGRISYYSNYFYNFPSEDFLYYLNDRLLYTERPDDVIIENGLRYHLLKIITTHKAIRNFIRANAKESADSVRFYLSKPDEYKKAAELLSFLGQQLRTTDRGQYFLIPNQAVGGSDYLQFTMMRTNVMEKQMNGTHYFNFQLTENNINLPPGSAGDLKFLSEITGITLDRDSFLENMVKNERFSLLMGILFRLSENEIRYISGLIDKPRLGAWKKIYNNKKMLIGMFVLSNALRVENNGGRLVLIVPGGENARSFWAQLAGDNVDVSSFDFLENIATKDSGKLNYLYVFSFFLPENLRKPLFFNYDPQRMKALCSYIELKDKEKLSDSALPFLDDWKYFTSMYMFKSDEKGIFIPQGADAWIRAISGKVSSPGSEGSQDSFLELLKLLLQKTGIGDKRITEYQKFMAIYSKFADRPQLLDGNNLRDMYFGYDRYNAILDFIEKIPVKKPGTVSALLAWVKTLETLNDKDQELFATLYQSLFEILSFTARYAPDRFDYDLLVTDLTKIPLSKAELYTRLFQFFEKDLNIKEKTKSLLDVMLSGVVDQNITIGSSNTRYRFLVKESFIDTVSKIFEAQQIPDYKTLYSIHYLLEDALVVKPPATVEIGNQLIDNTRDIPYSDISEDAPKELRARVISYSNSKLDKSVKDFVDKMNLGSDPKLLKEMADEIKSEYVIYPLRDHLLGLAYAVNACNPEIKAFLNPNFLRLHDLKGTTQSNSLWDAVIETNPLVILANKTKDPYAEYHLTGPISRLNLGFASRWMAHLFRENILYDSAHVQALIANILGFYPIPRGERAQEFNALAVNLGLELLRQAAPRETDEEEIDDEDIAPNTETPAPAIPSDPNADMRKQEIASILRTVTAGYHYRKAIEYLNGDSIQHNLFFTEIKHLGEAFFDTHRSANPTVWDRSKLPALRKLEPYRNPPLSDVIRTGNQESGNIFPYSFGNMNPRHFPLFPQEISNLMGVGWLSGSMIEEFNIKLAYHMYKKKVSPTLLGHFLYIYLNTSAKNYLRQNYVNDYHITYFVFDIFNNSHLNNLVKKLEKEGILRLK